MFVRASCLAHRVALFAVPVLVWLVTKSAHAVPLNACAERDLGVATGAGVATGSTANEDDTINLFSTVCDAPQGADSVLEFTAPHAGMYTFTLASDFTSLLEVFTDCGGGSALSCHTGVASVPLTQHQTVVIVIDGLFGGTGNWTLNIAAPPSPPEPPLVCQADVSPRILQTVSRTAPGVNGMSVEGSTFVDVGSPIAFTTADFDLHENAPLDVTAISSVEVDVSWAKGGECATMLGNASHQETRFRLVRDGVIFHQMVAGTEVATPSYSGAATTNHTTFITNTFSDDGSAPPFPVASGVPTGGNRLRPHQGPFFNSFFNTTPYASFQLQAATNTSGLFSSLCVEDWTLRVTVRHPLADIDGDGNSMVNEGSSIDVDMRCSADEAGYIVNYEHDCDAAVLGYTDDDTDGLQSCFYADEGTVGLGTGTYTAQTRVTDENSLLDTDTTVITVNNVVPVIQTIPGTSANPWVPYGGSFSATDEGADVLTFSLLNAPPGNPGINAAMSITGQTFGVSAASGTLAWVPACADIPGFNAMTGTAANRFYSVHVDDSDTGTDTDLVALVVTDVEDNSVAFDESDGATNCFDNCPFTSNTNQADYDADDFDLDAHKLGTPQTLRGGDACDDDDDNDGVFDTVEGTVGPTSIQDCRFSVSNAGDGFSPSFVSNPTTDHDGDGCEDGFMIGGYGPGEDNDDDNDGVLDPGDRCDPDSLGPTLGALGWVSTANTDYDSDGCRDADEDGDDDDDQMADGQDVCDPDTLGSPSGQLGWTSNSFTDHDQDGCRDGFPSTPTPPDGEDLDDDNDGRADGGDNCDPDSLGPMGGEVAWGSLGTGPNDVDLDYDNDGCKDEDGSDADQDDEDNDDDQDLIADATDRCDPDNVASPDFGVSASFRDWDSDTLNDFDQDGCRDADEDLDDDNDTRGDAADACDPSDGMGTGTVNPASIGWNSSSSTEDWDADGCQDSDAEDGDDDNDTVLDGVDSCRTSASNQGDGRSPPPPSFVSSTSGPGTDYDQDGCEDSHAEDGDDDNDGIADAQDLCDPDDVSTADPVTTSVTGWGSVPANDLDRDGCRDADEDGDDDNDQRGDGPDACDPDSGFGANDPIAAATGWDSQNPDQDYDADGCQDGDNEDPDRDNDGIGDPLDSCPESLSNAGADGDPSFIAVSDDPGNDYDFDGCEDAVEDDNDDNDDILDAADQCDPDSDSWGEIGWTASADPDYDADGCMDSEEDGDDDEDSVDDQFDSCPNSLSNAGDNQSPDFVSDTGTTDYDGDGCEDASIEDTDDDNDTRTDNVDACDFSNSNQGDATDPDFIASSGSPGNDYDFDGCEDADPEDSDDDNDLRADAQDDCDPDLNDPLLDLAKQALGSYFPTVMSSQRGTTLGTFDSTDDQQDHDDDGCLDQNTEDTNDDNDAYVDLSDRCSIGNVRWTGTDYDSDGCEDADPDEEMDLDNDGVLNGADACLRGLLIQPPFISMSSTDRDGDGCKDEGLGEEDGDDDNDGLADGADACDPDSTGAGTGDTGWVSNATTDHDSDGCRDAGEDGNDDNDPVLDGTDQCDPDSNKPASAVGWTGADFDGDGCQDGASAEDTDEDNDGVDDSSDTCFHGTLNWTSGPATDNDGDGCKDGNPGGEDGDDDNDGKADGLDQCPAGAIGWNSSDTDLDYDQDGCRDDEDGDDDNDGVGDGPDNCEQGARFVSSAVNDHDTDGCRDSDEDQDDDGDGVLDAAPDACPRGTLFTSNGTTDRDGDGCADAEDTDDDGDGLGDAPDQCDAPGATGWQSGPSTDRDSDGCRDSDEDLDDDNDGVLDAAPDNCQYVANPGQADADNNGVGDACDGDIDGDTIPNQTDNCPDAPNQNQLNTDGALAGGDANGDACDNDDDADGLADQSDNCPVNPNANQANMDSDAFGDVCDLDRDGDGVSNADEITLTLDPNDPDTDNDFIDDGDEVGPTPATPRNTDSAAPIDALDDDSDGDGALDSEEAGDDDLDTAPVNTDDPDDAIPDYRDLDSDGDGVADATDNCRIIDNANQANADGDAFGDLCDGDLDGDGIDDDVEDGLGTDPDDPDSDNDTIDDGTEVGNPLTPNNTDGDSTIDALDTDSDNDTVPDSVEAGDADLGTPPVNTDNQDLPDYRDLDSDGDGSPDLVDNCRLAVNPTQTNTDMSLAGGDMLGDVCDDDDDGDGDLDTADNCPLVANADQLNTDGALTGGDGLGDLCDTDDDADGDLDSADNCVVVPNPDQADLNDDGEGDACDADDDGDGVADDTDNCDATTNDTQTDTDGDEEGDACDTDDDGDGDLDTADNCPVNANADQADWNNDGEGDACDSDQVPVDMPEEDAGTTPDAGGQAGGPAPRPDAGRRDAGATEEPIECTIDALLEAANVDVPGTLDRESIEEALANSKVADIPLDAGIADIEQALADAGIVLEAGCDLEALLDSAAADAGLGGEGADDGCSCRTVGQERELGVLQTLLLASFGLLLAIRRRRRR